ncbi:hypothetical protein [Umezakia ovalisporum]|uniref:Uncharacterized protein n=2 Tax=Umezakia ovalisporum TaxID=75695 RepID=A0AA43KF84_9CYAN|nr:hypothetical protein [Umezakia ovalisporum]MBI1240341.1 hypothetical protein [Nostoc sp. RI_552]MDH6058240.1 hypothetical protein [Umezakia ovalisporum FSS-43]MDH6063810.1 hypothetical protein [Umezakia ovalisporum FSS-62]MDH6066981.1 hypothetical protein [Umezakia ovalisporum APH033B]MDH6072353.1 hypothetical protein [Umezakia ovalisporum CobakiLakeA]
MAKARSFGWFSGKLPQRQCGDLMLLEGIHGGAKGWLVLFYQFRQGIIKGDGKNTRERVKKWLEQYCE